MQRLFTFGCSFTQYWRWPTWADALGRQAKHFENWGMCGAGNGFIFNGLIECNQRNQLNSQDTVIVMWTNTSREDRYVGNRWLGMGNVYWTAGQELPEEYVRRYACERGYLIRDLAFVSAARMLLNSWGCNWKFLSMVPLSKTNEAAELGYNPEDTLTEDQDVRQMYKDVLDIIKPSVYETVFNGQWWTGNGIADTFDPCRRDFHPTPTEHVQYLKMICPDLVLSSDTVDWMHDWEQKIRNETDRWLEPNLPARL